jgi:putative ABC transport system substrate-binding protein
MRRREFITGLGSTAAGWPLGGLAQNAAAPVIGLLSARSARDSAKLGAAFGKGLNEVGYIEGKNVSIDYRWAEGRFDRLPSLAAELVRRPVAVLVAVGGSRSAIAAKNATSTIPIVFVIGGDPVRLGLVSSLAHPGGNATGVTIITQALAPKRLGLLRELVPKAASLAILTNPNSPEGEAQSSDALAAAKMLGLDLRALDAWDERSIEAAFASLAQERVDALLVGSDPIFDVQRDRLVRLAAKAAIPAIYQFRDFVAAGGLMSYDPDIADAYRQAGIYAGQVLKGARPADLPVLQPTKFHLVINMKTAKALGLSIPDSLLARADEVIE